MAVRGLLALVFLLLVPGGSLAAEGRPAPAEMAERLEAAVLPGRDPLDLATRLRGFLPLPAAPTPTAPAPMSVGREDSFWILDQRTAQLFRAQATLRLVTDHAYWFVEDSLADRAPQADLVRSANVFESRSYPLIHQYFGTEPQPGVDGDPRIVFLLANVPGVAAYFSSADAYARGVNPRSNEHEMIYVNLNGLRPGQTAFDSTIVHELQHMAQFAHCPSQEGWVDEGASELAMRIAGYDNGPPQAFIGQPAVQLNAWSQGADLIRHYQAAYLFIRYVAERAGGWDALPHLLASCNRGEALFGEFLKQQPLASDVESLFTDWAVANLVQDSAVGDGRYAYAGGGFHAATTGTATRGTPFLGSVPQYAANYVDLAPGAGTVTFAADAVAPLIDAPTDGGAWWSNRGDNLDSKLTRSFDLSNVNVSAATLQFQVWYDLESQFDFVYLSASRDGGRTWQVQPGKHAITDQATGNNYGAGWSGSSDGWLDESMDLSAFAGSQVLLRFEYVTDQSYNGQGFSLRGLSVPELDLSEPGAVEDAWQADGWVVVDAPVPQRWNLRLVRYRPDGTYVDVIDVAPEGSATFTLDPEATRSTLVVAPTAPRTLVPANYSVTVNP